MLDDQAIGPLIWSSDGINNLLDDSSLSNSDGIKRIATIVVARPEDAKFAAWPNAESFYRLMKRERPIAFRQANSYERGNFVSLYQFYGLTLPIQ